MDALAPAQALSIALGDGSRVGGLVQGPAQPRSAFVFAHGAGAGMGHAFMADVAAGLAQRGIATLRYEFPFMAAGSRRPDRPAVAHLAVRAAVAEAGRRFAGLPLIAGGKSFGARMTSQAQAGQPLDGVLGLAFIGFPLHPEGKPSIERTAHLAEVEVPMLFLQGTRDGLASPELLQSVVSGLGARATLAWFEDADHSFHVRARSGSNDAATRDRMLDAFAAWAAGIGA